MTIPSPGKLDADYRPFEPFKSWASSGLDRGLFDEYLARLQQVRQAAPSDIDDIDNKSLRKAALHTGALEGLHAADRGVTVTIVRHEVWREALVREAGADVLGHVEAGLSALDLALDLATHRLPIAHASIRALHERATSFQQTYSALVEVGGNLEWQDVSLPKGEYKSAPNHVLTADGSYHSYCPVADVFDEMQRLVDEVSSADFESAHPVLQAAFAHYALVAIHPFVDGNGRVARLLGSTYLLRAASVPLIIYADQKAEYLDALHEADEGQVGGFVRFVFDRAIDAIGWAADQVPAGSLTVGGPDILSPDEIKNRSLSIARIIDEASSAARREISHLAVWHDERWTVGDAGRTGPQSTHRHRRWGPHGGVVINVSSDFLDRVIGRSVWVSVSVRRTEFRLGLHSGLVNGEAELDLRDRDVYPEMTLSARERIEAYMRRVIADMVNELTTVVGAQGL